MRYPVSDAGSHLSGGKFTDGNPTTGAASSVDKAAHMNAVYDELIAIITALGGTPAEGNNTQIGTLLVPYIATAISNALIGLRNGVNTSLDTLWEIAQALDTKSTIGHGHGWGEISSKPALSDAVDQANSGQIATSAAVNALRNSVLFLLGLKSDKISGTWDNFYLPDINVRVKIGSASLTAASGAGMHAGIVSFPAAFPNNCFSVIPVLGYSDDVFIDYYATLAVGVHSAAGFLWKLRKFTIDGAWHCWYIAVGN